MINRIENTVQGNYAVSVSRGFCVYWSSASQLTHLKLHRSG